MKQCIHIAEKSWLAKYWHALKQLLLTHNPEINTATADKHSFRNKYQQLLLKGKLSDIIVLKVEKLKNNLLTGNELIRIDYKIPGEHPAKIHRSTAFADENNIPAGNTLIPAFHNPSDASILVLL